jgi:hydrogenase maturation protease
MADDRREARILILGIGNLLMGDEAIGIHVVRELQDLDRRPDVDVVDGGTGGFHLLEYFQTYDRLILVDAAADGASPGTVRLIRPRFSKDFPPTLTAHEIGLKDLLNAAQLLDAQPEIRLVTISIGEVPGARLELSAAIKAAIPQAARLVREQLST